jgi:hypothetical protein
MGKEPRMLAFGGGRRKRDCPGEESRCRWSKNQRDLDGSIMAKCTFLFTGLQLCQALSHDSTSLPQIPPLCCFRCP